MEATATLSIFRFEQTFIFSLVCQTKQANEGDNRKDEPAHTSTVYAPLSVGGETRIDTGLQEQLNHAISVVVTQLQSRYTDSTVVNQRSSSSSAQAGATLSHLGQFLFNYLLPPVVQDALRGLPEQLPILLQSNDSLLPWELLHDGDEYLALSHPIGRLLWSLQPIRSSSRALSGPAPSDNRSFLFICNPTGDLQSADEENEQLWDLFEPEFASGVTPCFVARKHATKWKVLQSLAAGHELIHYSGHAKPGALLLADGELTSDEIRQASRGRPFVFLNGCWSVKEGSNKLLSVNAQAEASLASAFMSAGAIGFIGTLWPVFDHSSRQVAELFYRHVRQGMSVGEALRQTRLQMSQAQPDDPIWASFVLYGDPRVHLIMSEPEETRSVTVLVAQLQGFEAIRFEVAVEMLEKAKRSLKQIAERYGGQVETPFSDLIKVYFGRTLAHGDDAEHACMAALDMIRTLAPRPPLNPPQYAARRRAAGGDQEGEVELGLRIGISSGRIINLGNETTGIVESDARKLAILAESGQIWADKATSRLARSRFTFSTSPVGTIRAAPGGQRAEAYRVVGSRRAHIRQAALFGRQKELTLLGQWWHEVATTGQGRLVGIMGAAGVGKTRLVAAFRLIITRDHEGDHEWISAVCYSYNQKQSYGLLAQLIRAKASLNAEDNYAIQREKLTKLVEGLLPRRGRKRRSGASSPSSAINEGVALLSRVIGLPFSWPELDNLDPKLRQKKLEGLVVALLSAKPMVLLLEDLQWADEASLAVLTKVVNAIGRMPLLLLALYRPDWSHDWGHTMHYRHLPLAELSHEAGRQLLGHLLGVAEPPQKLARMIQNQTGGNPFFIEEYVWLLQENGSLVRKGNSWTVSSAKMIVPGSVERVIQARLDRVPAKSRQLIQTAAVIGEKFEEELLQTVLEKDNRVTGCHTGLPLLMMRSLIYSEGGWPYSFYSFSHGLVHDIVYKLLPERFRRTIHRHVAQVLGQMYDEEEEILYRLAHHYYHSHDRINAIRYALQAAKRDANQWANQTALEWYGRALEKIESFSSLPPTNAEKETVTPSQMLKWQVEALEGQADVQKTIGQAEEAIKGYTQALELMATDANARRQADLYYKLATAYQDKGEFDTAQDALNKGLSILDGQVCLEAGRIHIYTGLIHFRRGRLLAGLASCEEAIAIIEKTSNSRDLAQVYNLQGLLSHHIGESEKAGEAYKQSIALYEEAQYLPGQERANFNLGGMYSDLGKWDAALDCLEKSRALSDRTGEMRRQAGVLNTLGEIYRQQGANERAILAYEEAQQILEELGFIEFVGIALMNQGVTYLKEGTQNKARACLSESLSLFQRLNANVHLPKVRRCLAELELLSGNPTKALQLAEEALNLVRKQAQKLEEGQIRRVLGQIYHELGQLSDAKTQLEESLTMLEERNNPYEIGLTLVELARLRQNLSEHNQTQHSQAIAECERAITIFSKLGAALDLKQALEIRASFKAEIA